MTLSSLESYLPTILCSVLAASVHTQGDGEFEAARGKGSASDWQALHALSVRDLERVWQAVLLTELGLPLHTNPTRQELGWPSEHDFAPGLFCRQGSCLWLCCLWFRGSVGFRVYMVWMRHLMTVLCAQLCAVLLQLGPGWGVDCCGHFGSYLLRWLTGCYS